LFKDFEVATIGGTQHARTLDRVQGQFVNIDCSNGEVISVYFDNNDSNHLGPANEYQHAVLMFLPNGTVHFASKNYNPSPYPQTNLNVLLFRHPTGKEWALVDEIGGNKVFYRSAQLTDERLVFQELKNNMSASERIIDKEKKGYVLVGNATYNCLTKTIEI
jgi:hypothetical protein